MPIGRRGGAGEGVRECGRAAERLGGRARAVTWGETQFLLRHKSLIVFRVADSFWRNVIFMASYK